MTDPPPLFMIRDVWSTNLEYEISQLRSTLEHYPLIAMDTEFPGVVARPIGQFQSSTDYHYQTLRCNVDLLKLIQLGITLCDARGGFPRAVCTWQFHFKFHLQEDMYAQESIDLLVKSGIDFKRHDVMGIDVQEFGEWLTTSGLVLNDQVQWISFHSNYDFGYLLKILTCEPLPAQEASFHQLFRLYFPKVYDLKHLMRACRSLKGGLQDVADELQVQRIGPPHQAGSDALLTALVFFKMREIYFDGVIDQKYSGVLYGLTSGGGGGGSNSISTLVTAQ